MTIKNFDQIKITSKNGKFGKLANKLREITKLPQLKDLENSVVIGDYSKDSIYGVLSIVPKGLEETIGYRDSNAELGSGRTDRREIESLKDFIKIIKTYKISEEDINKLYSKLTK